MWASSGNILVAFLVSVSLFFAEEMTESYRPEKWKQLSPKKGDHFKRKGKSRVFPIHFQGQTCC